MDNVLIIGSGARENAMADALVRNSNVKLFSCQEYNNYGITRISEKVINTERDSNRIIKFCKENNIDFCVIGPEAAIETGIVDLLNNTGFPCASPSKNAARIETNKCYARELLDKYKIDGQIKYLYTTKLEEAIKFCNELNWKVAVKPIGLTAGKGVKVWGDHLKNSNEVKEYINEILTKQISNHNAVILEELLIGQEFTLHFFCDGNTAIPTPPIQDHKRAFDNDKGPNTGGMGAYSTSEGLPFLDSNDYNFCCKIGQDVINALKNEQNPFKGILYGQFIITENGPKIIEFNSRFGDPEAMNTLMLLESDYPTICKKIIEGKLTKELLKFKKNASLTCYVVPKGYGESPISNEEVLINEEEVNLYGAKVFYGSCNFIDKKEEVIRIKTTTSRTLAIAATGENLEELHKKILLLLNNVKGTVFYRKDIGSQQSIEQKINMMNKLKNNKI